MNQAPHSPRLHSQSGSAYLVALLALVVLSIVGLALALITQTEMQTGATEMTLQRTFYGADSGVSRSMARTFAHFDCTPMLGTDFTIVDPDITSVATPWNLREEVSVTASLPINDPPCPLCSINNAGGSDEKGKQDYYEIHHVVTADAQRRLGTDRAAERQIGSFFSLQPWPKIKDCYDFVGSAEAAKVKM
jgi:hypothetical protein